MPPSWTNVAGGEAEVDSEDTPVLRGKTFSSKRRQPR
jgi:hypothetical protein